ncbi:MFS transporter [Streptomyces sp. NPDC018059]|uniref:MFS transporter n=1 Tax=Streptomyces sp. NPDC018059 TaxID=3365041 RepID=UPI0037B55074
MAGPAGRTRRVGSGFFVAAEFALVAAKRHRREQAGTGVEPRQAGHRAQPGVLRALPSRASLVTSATACGALAATLTASRIRSRRPGTVAMLGLLCELPQIVAVAVGAPTAWVVAFSALAGAGASVFAVLWGAALQERTPDHMLGRVYALDALLTQALMPLCVAAAGFLLGVLSAALIAAFAACALLLTVVAVLPVPGVAMLGTTTPDEEPDRSPHDQKSAR